MVRLRTRRTPSPSLSLYPSRVRLARTRYALAPPPSPPLAPLAPSRQSRHRVHAFFVVVSLFYSPRRSFPPPRLNRLRRLLFHLLLSIKSLARETVETPRGEETQSRRTRVLRFERLFFCVYYSFCTRGVSRVRARR